MTSIGGKQELQQEEKGSKHHFQLSPESPPAKKRRTENAVPTILAPKTPSPRKIRKVEEQRARAQSPTNFTRRVNQKQPRNAVALPERRSGDSSLLMGKKNKYEKYSCEEENKDDAQPAFLTVLKTLTTSKVDDTESIVRTDGFDEKPISQTSLKETKRDDRLAVIEELVPGPADHKPIEGDPEFETVEPNSGIRLKSRNLSHSALQDYLYGRYFLPPSLLYSVVRLRANKQAYEVPVDGDWVTVAVVAERGDVRVTGGSANFLQGKGDRDSALDGDDDDKKEKGTSGRGKEKNVEGDDGTRKGGRKYVHLKLIDLGHRSRTTSSSDSLRGTLRGDAHLSLLLFESDYFDKMISNENGKEKVRKLWRGGSRGAFEECYTRLREGTVIALLNPKVLKPFQNTRNPTSSSILALTPPSSSAIAVIGVAADLGRCTVTKRDGKPCGSWVDRRVGRAGPSSKSSMEDVCEYHIQTAVQRVRAGRSEFSVGTSGMSTTARKGRNNTEYDPTRQWGLKPENGSKGPGGELTYVFGGVVASSSRATAPGITEQNIGREGQARAKRRIENRDNDRQLALLLGKRDGSTSSGSHAGGSSKEALEIVRRAAQKAPKKDSDKESERVEYEEPRRKAYSAEMLKCLGFDPTAKAYGASKSKHIDKKSIPIHKLKNSESSRNIFLGAPPGAKVRSGVSVPTNIKGQKEESLRERPSTDSSSDLEIEPPEQSSLSHECGDSIDIEYD